MSRFILIFGAVYFLYPVNGLKIKRQTIVDNSEIEKSNNCHCVRYYNCDNGCINTSGKDLFDPRLGEDAEKLPLIQCNGGNFPGEILCCRLCRNNSAVTVTVTDETVDTTTDPTKKPRACGNQLTLINRILTDDEDNTNAVIGEFPWVVAIFRKKGEIWVQHCVGSLIHPKVVLTVNHYVRSYEPSKLKVLANNNVESGSIENNSIYERDVEKVIKHPDYYSGAYHNDVAMLILKEPYDLTNKDHIINTICLNPSLPFENKRCLVVGWGQTANDKKSEVLRRVDVPIVNRTECQELLRKTRLGNEFQLHESHLCAGGEYNKDACYDFTMIKLSFLIIFLTPPFCKGANHSWYPSFHLAPQKGWMNDPNGLSYFDGYYHAFYQHYPYGPQWGLMHWGHARSTNMLDWEHLPIALTPSLPEDIDGIFSGSAVVNEGNLTLMYTGVSGGSTHQAQCIASSSDGVNFEKVGVVLKKDGDDRDFRDPKLWFQNGSWFVLVGSKTDDNKGQVLLYKSPDLRNWTYQGVFAQSDGKLGYMWECPDFFTLGDKQILVINPQGIATDGYDYQNLFQTGYFVGTWEPGTEYKIEKEFREIDHGHNFYAAQTFLAPDGRRILIGWLDMWASPYPEQSEGWAGMLTLPRELTLSESGDLEIRPVKETKKMRKAISKSKTSLFIGEDSSYVLVENAVGHQVCLEFDPSESNATIYGVQMGDDDNGWHVYVDGAVGRVFLERSYSEFNIPNSNRSLAIDVSQTIYLNFFIDSSSVELFVNDGLGVLSSRIYPTDDKMNLVVQALSGVVKLSHYSVWSLK